MTGTYDPATNLAFWGTGNGGPWMGDQRPGDNLYTSSTISPSDVTTRRIKGSFPVSPERFVGLGRSVAAHPRRLPARNGRTVKGLIDVARDGYLWFLERTDSRINFVEGTPFVKQNVFTSLGADRAAGRRSRAGPAPIQRRSLSTHWGGKNWPPIAFSPKTRMIYIPANENLCGRIVGRPIAYAAGKGFTGATNALLMVPGADHIGEVQAWNVDTPASGCGRTISREPRTVVPAQPPAAEAMFSGGTNDRMFRAFERVDGAGVVGFPTAQASSASSHRRSWLTAGNTSPCNRAGASTREPCNHA